MIIIGPKEFKENQKKYLDLADKERVIIRRNQTEDYELVKRKRTGETFITGEELVRAVHKNIDAFPDKK